MSALVPAQKVRLLHNKSGRDSKQIQKGKRAAEYNEQGLKRQEGKSGTEEVGKTRSRGWPEKKMIDSISKVIFFFQSIIGTYHKADGDQTSQAVEVCHTHFGYFIYH